VALTLLRLAFLTEVVAAALLHCRGVSRGWGAAVLGSDSGGEFGEGLRYRCRRLTSVPSS
jgi:hypothetical protein